MFSTFPKIGPNIFKDLTRKNPEKTTPTVEDQLKTTSKMSNEESYEILRKEKPHVYPYSDRAKAVLIQNKFWPEN